MCPLCHAHRHPALIAELSETYLILGDNQGCPGWCTAILKDHHEHLAEFSPDRQARIFRDVAAAAAAIRTTLGPLRLNYECLGNVVPHIHWHIIPRHLNDPTPRETVWNWPPARLKGTLTDEDRAALIARLRAAL